MAYPVKAQWAGIIKWLIEAGSESERNDILKQIAEIDFDNSELDDLNKKAQKNNIIESETCIKGNNGSSNISSTIENILKNKTYSFLNSTNNVKLMNLGNNIVRDASSIYIDSIKEERKYSSLENILNKEIMAMLEKEAQEIKDTLLNDINEDGRLALLLNRHQETLPVYLNSFTTQERNNLNHLLYWGIIADSNKRLFPKNEIIDGRTLKFKTTHNGVEIISNNIIIGIIKNKTEIECKSFELLNLIPYGNKKYIVGANSYTTDILGRINQVNVSLSRNIAKNKFKKQLKEKDIIKAQQQNINDMAFYLIPKEYGGISCYMNILPIEKNKINKKNIKGYKKGIKETLKSHNYINISITISYNKGSLYPSQINLLNSTLINTLAGKGTKIGKIENSMKKEEANYLRELIKYKDKSSDIYKNQYTKSIIQTKKSFVTSNNIQKSNSIDRYILKGKINRKYGIMMQIKIEDGVVSGNYYYTKYGSNNTLRLTGSLSNEKMQLTEYNEKGENTGFFDGILESNSYYHGTFTNYKGTKMSFELYRE